MKMKRQVIFLVEVGWRRMREFSIFLAQSDFFIDVIIKGRVSRDILDIITKHEKIKIRSIPRNFFRLFVFWKIIKEKLIGNLRCAVVSKSRTKGWMGVVGRALNFKTFELIEANDGYRLIGEDGGEISKAEVVSLI